MLCRLLFVLLSFFFVLSVLLRYTDSDCPLGIFKLFLYSIDSLDDSSRWPKTWNILFRHKHTIIYYSGFRSRHDPTVFPESNTDFGWRFFAPIFNLFFGREKNCFLSSRKDIWRVVAFNSVLIYFGSYLPYLVSRLPIISGFLLYWPNPLFCSHCPNNHCIIIHAVFLTYPAFIYTVKEDSSSAVLKDISINIFAIYLFPCSFCSSVRQIFWCCGWNKIYLHFDVLFWTRLVIFLKHYRTLFFR
jgi:hypothetical protein